ncbi:hypothetical protein ABT297_36860 [Dactylosporangium sp. NPDC000555]|uniref:hypothetical protein n=1 Tax=Dactylosporangium sp. NPDC000555 TaxID=3154260 RepID=UPI003323EFD2
MEVTHATWPGDGKLGRCRAGEYRGWFALFTAEIEDFWIVYLASVTPGRETQYDDFSTRGDAQMQRLIEEFDVEWFAPSDEVVLEEEVFGLRSHWRAEGHLK